MKTHTPRATIYRLERPATQSGCKRAGVWVLTYRPQEPKNIEPIMRWTSSRDTRSTEVAVYFPSLAKAIEYTERNGIEYDLIKPAPEYTPKIRRYNDNFK